MPPRADYRAGTVTDTVQGAAIWPAAQVGEAEQIAQRLGRYAVAIVGPDAIVDACGMPGCPVDDHTAGRTAARLAVALAAAFGACQDVVVPRASRDLLVAHRRFVDQLSDAAASVYCCRRTVHHSGRCFFDRSGPDSGLCGRVLAVSRHYELGLLAG